MTLSELHPTQVRASPSEEVAEALVGIEDPAEVANNVNHQVNTHSWEKMHRCNKSDFQLMRIVGTV